MIRFTIGVVGLIAIASANDDVNLGFLALAAVPFVALMLWALPDIAE